MGVLEQVGGLSVDLKRILVAEEIRIEKFLTHPLIVLQAITAVLAVLAGRSQTGSKVAAIESGGLIDERQPPLALSDTLSLASIHIGG